MDLAGLSASYGLLKNTGNHGWRHVKNLDAFYKNMYRFYEQKGLYAILLSEATAVLSLGFTIGISIFLIAFLNWPALLACTDEETCRDVNQNFVLNPFAHTPTLYSVFTALYFILFGLLWVMRAIMAVNAVSNAFEMEEFYRLQLRVQSADLPYLPWHLVLGRFIDLHHSGAFRIAVQEQLTVQDIVLRIMRRENYLIALINQQVTKS